MNTEPRVGVLGLGKEGQDTLKFLNKLGFRPVGLDSRPKSNWDRSAYREIKKLTSSLCLGEDCLEELNDFTIVLRTPGVPLDLPAIKQARRRRVVISSPTQLFFELCPAKIIGITGTKGKSTTTSLVYHFLKGQVPGRVYIGGNIGKPFLTLLPKLSKKDWMVLELSSFQLEDLMLSPHISVLLAVSAEHLDRHHQFKNYLAAKANIYLHQRKGDYLIASADYPLTRQALQRTPGRKFPYSLRKILPRGLYLLNGEIIYRDVRTGRRNILARQDQIKLLGQHNLENVLAALAVALVAGVKPGILRRRLATFKSLPYRLESVGKIGNVSFINDSLATTPVATIAAINTIPEQLSVIIGGVSKRENIKELIAALNSSRVNGIVLIGKSTPRLKREFKTAKLRMPYTTSKTLSAAVEAAYRYVKNGGTVLLSPAFASFDMFKDAYDRGEQFRMVVGKLIKKYKQ